MARGALKNQGITPIAGDVVEFLETEKIIEKIYERKNFIKRPKIANITQIVFVISMKHPKPDLLLLDKQLAFAESLGLKSLIVFNKCDLLSKSTIINSLFNNKITQEGEISEKSKKGKNTTTLVRLYELEENSFIADTPGFSTFDVFEIKTEDLSHYFVEFLPFIKECSYGGCSHINESEDYCKVKQALLEGKISKTRYNNYCKIYNELKEHKTW